MPDEKQRMYKGLVKKLLALVLFLIFIAGCTTTYRDMSSWEGQTVDELYWDMGRPDKIEVLGNGNRVFIYEDDRTDKKGNVRTCRRSFTAVNYGNKEEITDTSYSGCSFLTIKSR
jgi:outer membrane lipoprotein-sorting protein